MAQTGFKYTQPHSAVRLHINIHKHYAEDKNTIWSSQCVNVTSQSCPHCLKTRNRSRDNLEYTYSLSSPAFIYFKGTVSRGLFVPKNFPSTNIQNCLMVETKVEYITDYFKHLLVPLILIWYGIFLYWALRSSFEVGVVTLHYSKIPCCRRYKTISTCWW